MVTQRLRKVRELSKCPCLEGQGWTVKVPNTLAAIDLQIGTKPYSLDETHDDAFTRLLTGAGTLRLCRRVLLFAIEICEIANYLELYIEREKMYVDRADFSYLSFLCIRKRCSYSYTKVKIFRQCAMCI